MKNRFTLRKLCFNSRMLLHLVHLINDWNQCNHHGRFKMVHKIFAFIPINYLFHDSKQLLGSQVSQITNIWKDMAEKVENSQKWLNFWFFKCIYLLTPLTFYGVWYQLSTKNFKSYKMQLKNFAKVANWRFWRFWVAILAILKRRARSIFLFYSSFCRILFIDWFDVRVEPWTLKAIQI